LAVFGELSDLILSGQQEFLDASGHLCPTLPGTPIIRIA